MAEMIELKETEEGLSLVGVRIGVSENMEDALDELAELAETAGHRPSGASCRTGRAFTRLLISEKENCGT